jgi:hypothetical protein
VLRDLILLSAVNWGFPFIKKKEEKGGQPDWAARRPYSRATQLVT